MTQPANGTVAITGGGTGLTYQPDADYCNDPPGTTPDTFTYTLTPGGSTATVTVTVTCVDDAPVAVADTATVVEDDRGDGDRVLANDTDVDGGPIAVDVGDAAGQRDGGDHQRRGRADLHAGRRLLQRPDRRHAPDTFTYTLTPGGSTATVSVTVTCVDDDPVAVDDTATVVEDDRGDGDRRVGQRHRCRRRSDRRSTSVTQPANGTVVITGGGTGLTYQPDANYCNDPTGAAAGHVHLHAHRRLDRPRCR